MKITQIIQIAVTIIFAVIMALFTYLSSTNASILAEIKKELKEHASDIGTNKTNIALYSRDIDYIKKSQSSQEEMLCQIYNYMFGSTKKMAE